MVTTSVLVLVMQLYNAEVWGLEKCTYIVSPSKHLLCQVAVRNSADRLSSGTDGWTLHFPCCSHGGLHCAASPWDIWWWEVASRLYNAPRDICQDLWPSITPSCQSRHFSQAPSIHEVTKKTLGYPIWTSRASGLKTHPYKLDWNHISNHLTMWFGSDLQKPEFMCFIAVHSSLNQSGFSLDMSKIRFGLAVWTQPNSPGGLELRI